MIPLPTPRKNNGNMTKGRLVKDGIERLSHTVIEILCVSEVT